MTDAIDSLMAQLAVIKEMAYAEIVNLRTSRGIAYRMLSEAAKDSEMYFRMCRTEEHGARVISDAEEYADNPSRQKSKTIIALETLPERVEALLRVISELRDFRREFPDVLAGTAVDDAIIALDVEVNEK